LHFSLGHTMRSFWKIFAFFIWAGHPLQWDHLKKPLYSSPRRSPMTIWPI
jgi:hypothetical protein